MASPFLVAGAAGRAVAIGRTHWRLSFHDPELNVADAGAIERLRRLIDRIDDVADLKVVVFDGAGPEFHLACGDRESAKLI